MLPVHLPGGLIFLVRQSFRPVSIHVTAVLSSGILMEEVRKTMHTHHRIMGEGTRKV